MTTPNKTPAYILSCQKRYYDRIKDTEEFKTKRRQRNQIYYEKRKEKKQTLNRLHVSEAEWQTSQHPGTMIKTNKAQ